MAWNEGGNMRVKEKQKNGRLDFLEARKKWDNCNVSTVLIWRVNGRPGAQNIKDSLLQSSRKAEEEKEPQNVLENLGNAIFKT